MLEIDRADLCGLFGGGKWLGFCCFTGPKRGLVELWVGSDVVPSSFSIERCGVEFGLFFEFWEEFGLCEELCEGL